MRIPPHSLDAERSVLGCILIKPSNIDEASSSLRIDDFCLPAHREIFQSMLAIDRDGHPIDVVLLADDLRARDVMGKLEEGEMYLLRLTREIPTGENVRHYIRVVKEKSVLRSIITKSMEFGARAHGDVDAENFLAEYQVALEKIEMSSATGPTPVGSIYHDSLEAIERRKLQPSLARVNTGLRAFDEKFGLYCGRYIIVAQRPGLGKTAFALTTLTRMAIDGTPCLVFSYEMKKQRMFERVVSFVAKVEGHAIVRGDLTAEAWRTINEEVKRIYAAPLYFDDRRNLTCEKLCAAVKRWCREIDQAAPRELPPPQKVVAVDYIGLMNLEQRTRSRTDDVGEMSRMLKKLAEDIDIPLIVLVQLNREIDKAGKPRRPRLSDLRDAGAIEQDADMVIFPYREGAPSGPSTGPTPVTLIVEKNRDGATGEAEVTWDGRYMAFYDVGE